MVIIWAVFASIMHITLLCFPNIQKCSLYDAVTYES